MQDCSICIANALEILQSCTEPSMWYRWAPRTLLSGKLCSMEVGNPSVSLLLVGSSFHVDNILCNCKSTDYDAHQAGLSIIEQGPLSLIWISYQLTLYVLGCSEKTWIYDPLFSIISRCWDKESTWNPSSWKTRIYSSYIVNTVAADDLAMHGARASSAMLLI